ncbi:ankyrin repeat domain-containing protein [Legionella sp. CNM-4043-24]|uniref:ankyrin repeat domain-containing protein n=1 Tax=Legionella sp. CNM-4043-24 TaxID=3421646 RepID=UPI00403A8FBF
MLSSSRILLQRAASSSSHSPAIETPAQAGWQTSWLRKSSIYLENIIHPMDRKIRLHCTPACILGFENQDYRSPIQHFVIARHLEGQLSCQGKKDYVSMLLYPRLLVSNKIREHFIDICHEIYNRDGYDAMPRLAITKNMQNPSEKAELVAFIELIAKFTPFSPLDWTRLNRLMTATRDELNTMGGLKPDARTMPYFRSARDVPIGGGRQQYIDRHDRVIPTEKPLLHQAILNADEDEVKRLLEADPFLANSRDEHGMPAHRLAKKLKLPRILQALHQARQYPGVLESRLDRLNQDYYQRLFKEETDSLPPDTIDQAEFEKYMTLVSEPGPRQRSPLHTACIEGNLPAVRELLQEAPDRLESRDPLGFTPLILAAANHHSDLVNHLIERGASLNGYSHRHLDEYLYYHLIDNIKTPEAMEKFLYHGISVEEATRRLADAVRDNDFAMVETLLFYIRSLPVDQAGISPLEIAVRNLKPGQTDILDCLLTFWPHYVPDGPYDEKNLPETPNDLVITPDIAEVFKRHNERLDKRASRKHRENLFIENSTVCEQGIETRLSLDGVTYRSLIKSASELTDEERQQLLTKPEQFRFLGGENARSQVDYFNAMLLPQPTDANRQSYVDVWQTLDGNITNFFAFDIERVEDPESGHMIFFHAKLACSFAPVGVAELNCHRVSLSLMKRNPDARVFVFFRAIPPGFGMSFLPDGIPYYPKHHIPESARVFASKGMPVDYENKVVATDVNALRPLTFFQMSQRYHRHITQGAEDKALPVCYCIDETSAHWVYAKLATYDVSDIQAFASVWQNYEASQRMELPKARL